ncbi:hypothetical protein Bbelb_166860 [Branchiostoma belcheri]|nr:hypothetical protein Bbelb_166860 [Branchiostoma belcheri]
MGAAARDLLAALLEGVFASGDVQTTTLAFSIASMGAAARDLLAALLEGVFASGDVQTTTLAFSIACSLGFSVACLVLGLVYGRQSPRPQRPARTSSFSSGLASTASGSSKRIVLGYLKSRSMDLSVRSQVHLKDDTSCSTSLYSSRVASRGGSTGNAPGVIQQMPHRAAANPAINQSEALKGSDHTCYTYTASTGTEDVCCVAVRVNSRSATCTARL